MCNIIVNMTIIYADDTVHFNSSAPDTTLVKKRDYDQEIPAFGNKRKGH